MAKRKIGKNRKVIRKLAKTDATIKQMIDLYELGLFKKRCKNFEDFLVGLVTVLSTVNDALYKHIDKLEKQPSSVYGSRGEDC